MNWKLIKKNNKLPSKREIARATETAPSGISKIERAQLRHQGRVEKFKALLVAKPGDK